MTKEAQIYWNTLSDNNAHSPIPILLIDDNSIDNLINKKILEFYSAFNITVFNSGSLALEHLAKTKIRYHYIFVDLVMPVIDGFTFIEKFNQLQFNKQQGQLIILTASLNPSDMLKAKNLNIKFVEKPLTLDKLSIAQNEK